MNVNIESQEKPFHPAVWFWSVTLSFAGLWVLLPYLFHTGYQPDVSELQMIAKEWVLATRKHPMFPAWILETINILTNRTFIAPFIASAFCTILTLFSVWQLARKVLSERLALIGTLSMLPFWSITVESVNFNQNTVLMACWTLTMLMFYNAFQTNKKRWWIAAGLTLGLGFQAKYTMIFLALAVLVYSLWVPRFRRYWKEIGPWLTVMISFAVFVPHLIWLHYAGFWSTMSYALERQHSTESSSLVFVHRIVNPVLWTVCQFGLIILSPLLLLIPCLGRKWKIRTPQSEIEKETLQYLFCCMAFPFTILAIVAAAFNTNVTAAYGYTLWFFLGVYLLMRFQHRDSPAIFLRTLRWTSLVVSVLVIVFIVQAVVSPYLTGTARRFHTPMRELGEECDRIWSHHFADIPCLYISGSWRYAANAAYAMKDRPSVHFYYNNIHDLNALPTGTWSTDEDVNQKGGIILWRASQSKEKRGNVFGGIRLRGETPEVPELHVPDWVHRRFPRAEVLPELLVIPYKTGAQIPPLHIGVALVPPPQKPYNVPKR